MSDDSPILFQQRPNVRDPPTDHWQAAYGLDSEYLQEYNLHLTREAAFTEFPQFPTVDSLVSRQESSGHFSALVQRFDADPPQSSQKLSDTDSPSGSDESTGVGSPLPQRRRGQQLAGVIQSSAAEQRSQGQRTSSGGRRVRIQATPNRAGADDPLASQESSGSETLND
jgi:hypothetical protein